MRAQDQNRARLRSFEAINILVCLPNFRYVIQKINTIKPQKNVESLTKVLTFPMMNTSIVSLKYQILYSFEPNFKNDNFLNDCAVLMS